ncbi:MAG: carboxypeptidase regulatory-like domain-containing protein [Ignavibacteriales bacterium]|nr:carboxypeptidase regulatory-like domain-containing protein [Ignavibacteriales bacterium]
MKVFFKTIFINLCFISILFAQQPVPENLVAEVANFQIENQSQIFVHLNWDKVTDSNGDSAPLYNIYRKDGNISNDNEFVSLGSVLWNTSFMDRTVNVGSTYTYYITSMKEVESAPSEMVEIIVEENSIGIASSKVSGKVRDESTLDPLAGVYVTLISKMNFTSHSVMTDNEGNFSTEVIPGDYIVYFKSNSGYYSEFYDNVNHVWEATILTLDADQTYSDINADLTPLNFGEIFSISGSVSDVEGHPVEAMIDIMKVGKQSRNPLNHHRVTTDSDGKFIVNVPEGIEVVVYAYPNDPSLAGEFFDDSYSLANAAKLEVTQNIENINFILASKSAGTSTINGNIHNSNNETVQAMVVAVNLGMNRYDRKNNLRVFADENGNYSFKDLTNGDYILFALPEEGYLPTFYKEDGTFTFKWKDADILTLEDNTILSNIDFALTPVPAIPENGFAEIGGTILDNLGQPLPDASVYIFNNANEIVSYSITDKNGHYSASGLIPGKYLVVCDNYAYSNGAESDVYLGYDQPATLNFTLNSEIALNINEFKVVNTYQLLQNYPNPFNPTTKIYFSILDKNNVNLTIYDILGREIKVLVNRQLNPGEYNYQFNANDLPSGIYLYKLTAGNFTQTKKMMLLK